MNKNFLAQIQKYNPKTLFKEKSKYLLLGIGGVSLALVLLINIFGPKNLEAPKQVKKSVKLDIPSTSLNTEDLWRNKVEEKIIEQKQDSEKELEKLKAELEIAKTKESQNQDKVRDLEEKLNFILAELSDSKTHKDQSLKLDEAHQQAKLFKYSVNLINPKNSKDYEPIKTIDNYIPPATMVKAYLSTGLSVSTSIKTVNSPDPVKFYLVDHGILPRRFRNDIKECAIIGSAHGDLSSERVKIRLEKLSCIEGRTGETIITDVAGYVTGPDGYEGIKGDIVSMDQKYLMYAQVFGTISGFAKSSIQDSTVYNPLTIGLGAVKPMDTNTKLKNNAINGAAGSLDRLAEYYIDRAESIQPVIQVPAGQRIDIHFTEGSFFGSSTLKQKLAKKHDTALSNSNDSNSNLNEKIGLINE